MPFKHNAACRHRLGKMKFKVANWAEYEAGLRRRRSLTLWMTAEALSYWQAAKRTTRGGRPRYSDLAIETALTIGLMFGLRLRQTEGLLTSVPIWQFTADGAYDGNPTYDAVTSHSVGAMVVIPPRAKAVERSDTEPSNQRDRHIAAITTEGRMKWQVVTGYGKRSLVETAIGRYKAIIGRRLRARSFSAQQTEVAIGCPVLNRMLACARPKSVGRIGTTS
jgi:hypothetical protein